MRLTNSGMCPEHEPWSHGSWALVLALPLNYYVISYLPLYLCKMGKTIAPTYKGS